MPHREDAGAYRRRDAILVVTAGDAKIDNAKYRALFHAKAKMLTPEETSELIGHAPGGVCPFAVNDGVKICLDVSLKRFDEVFPACGSGNSAIGLTIPELEKYSGYPEWDGRLQAIRTAIIYQENINEHLRK